jgi:hypothetical protein
VNRPALPCACRTANAPARAFAVFVSLAGAAALGCAATPTRAPESDTTTRSTAREAPRAPIAAPQSLVQRMRRLGFLPLAVLLPDAEGWVTARDEARLYEVAHAASASRLTAELLEGSFGTSVQCAHTSPRAPSDARTRFDEGTIRAPLALEVAFDAHADERDDRSVSGGIHAFTAYAGRCVRLRFETRARGEDAAAEVGARLAFFRDVSLPSLLIVRDGHGPAPVRTSLERR